MMQRALKEAGIERGAGALGLGAAAVPAPVLRWSAPGSITAMQRSDTSTRPDLRYWPDICGTRSAHPLAFG